MPLYEPVVPDSEVIRYLPNGLAVLEADKRFKTELHRQLPMMTRANMQVYEWLKGQNLLLVLSRYRRRWELRSVWNNQGEEVDASSQILEHLRLHAVEGPVELIDRVELFQKAGEFDLNMVAIRLR